MDERDEQQYIEISGTVKGVVFQNEENGYTVLRLDVGGEEPITVVGCLPFAASGEGLTVSGSWERHPSHGTQFKAVSAQRRLPVGERAIYAYLASGAVKGIGAATATLLVDKFGPRTLEVLSETPEKLTEIRGITLRKAQSFSEAFRRQAGIRSLMEFLSANGLRPEYAMRLYRVYGDESLALLKANPYLIASERIGGQFEEADALALSLGFEDDSPERISAALIFEMRHNLKNGHSFLPREKLTAATAQLIGVTVEAAEECLDVLEDEEEVVICPVANVTAVYLRSLYEAEVYVSARLRSMGEKIIKNELDMGVLCHEVELSQGIRYAPMQRKAIELAAERQLLALTGGPGTGKTTIIRGLLKLFDELQTDVLLCAPTGRAAQRMSELTGEEAYTIHRLLGAGWAAEGDALVFRKNEDDPLKCGAVILDECSMVDITLMQALLKALPRNCRLILVGDTDQLPSVGPGCVFLDILRSGVIAAVRLREVFRQGEESRIVRNAHLINEGAHPDLRENTGDFFFMQRGTGDRIANTVVELCRDRLPAKMGYDPMDIQVLSATRRGESGTYALNKALQAALNPPKPDKKEKIFGEGVFREGDRVMQVRNDYDILWTRGSESGNGIFNGDVGRILSVDMDNELLWIDFDGKLTPYGFEQLGELELAYAVTVHKSQGSEYPAVVLAAGRAPARLLSRDLLYTAVTRARRLLVTVGDQTIVHTMIENGRKTRRYSGLRARLAGEA
ncbi:MAG: ATP-dependent RecD-like DNA helicase [Oscillospiraceae bacterium]|nr:ATP-dependent RecD-like DNA helicase [Oscillospiraceae bacterium]